MLSDSEKVELHNIVVKAVAPLIAELKTEIAAGFVEILECTMADLASILMARNEDWQKRVEAVRKASPETKTRDWMDKVLG